MTLTSEVSIDGATPLALAALTDITPADTIGDIVDHTVAEDGVMTVRFHTKLLGYRGWFWTVALAAVDGAEPTVLEAELLPGDDALLAPDWVPWSLRLEEYKAQQAAAEAEKEGVDDSDDGDNASDEDDSDDDLHTDGSEYLHAGDVDGVNIDDYEE